MKSIVVLWCLLLAFAVEGAVVVRRAGPAPALSNALLAALEKNPVDGVALVVQLSGDGAADAARVTRGIEKASVVFTIGPEAVSALASMSGNREIVALGIPNPAKMALAATYVSAYPRFEDVLAYAETRLGAKRIGVVHSPGQNREIAAAMQKAASSRGMVVVPIAASSSGELVRALSGIEKNVDALFLAIDPIVFDRQSLRFIIEKATAAKKPTVGFLPDLVGLGVTVVLMTDPAAVARTALAAARTAARGRVTIDVDGMIVVVSKRAAERIGLNAGAMGANEIR